MKRQAQKSLPRLCFCTKFYNFNMSDISLLNKIQEYNEKHCYQYQKRLDTLDEDKKKLGFTDEDI